MLQDAAQLASRPGILRRARSLSEPQLVLDRLVDEQAHAQGQAAVRRPRSRSAFSGRHQQRQRVRRQADAKRLMWFASLETAAAQQAASGAVGRGHSSGGGGGAGRSHGGSGGGGVVAAGGGGPGGVAAAPELHARVEALRRAASSRCVQRRWREFARQHKTTRQLAEAFIATGIPAIGQPAPSGGYAGGGGDSGSAQAGVAAAGFVVVGGVGGGGASPEEERFEDFARRLQDPAALHAAQALLRRLEARLAARGAASTASTMLLRRMHPGAGAAGRRVPRFPARHVLSAYMIIAHPEWVFNTKGEVVERLTDAASGMLSALEALLLRLVQPELPAPGGESGGEPLAALLLRFDDMWLEYLDQFSVWKGGDAASLAGDLVRTAATLEGSLLRKLGGDAVNSERVQANADLQAMVAQNIHDQALLRERVDHLVGSTGLQMLDAALTAVRADVEAELEEVASEASWETERSRPPSRSMSRQGSARLSRHSSTTDVQAAPDSGHSTPSIPSPQRAAISAAGRTAPLPASPARPRALRAAAAATASPRPPRAAAQPPRAHQPAAAAPPENGLSNEQMVWEMLYSPGYKLPSAEAQAAWHRALGRPEEGLPRDEEDIVSMTQEQVALFISRRTRTVAELAFWRAIEERLAVCCRRGELVGQLAPLVSELGLEAAAAVAGSDAADAAQLRGMYDEGVVLSWLMGPREVASDARGRRVGGACVASMLGSLDGVARVLLTASEGELRDEATSAVASAQRRLLAAVGRDGGGADEVVNWEGFPADASSAGGASASGGGAIPDAATKLASALVAALRMLLALAKMVRVGAASAQLAALMAALRESGAVGYLRAKLAASWQLPAAGAGDAAERAALAERLPLTATWVRELAAAGSASSALKASLAAAVGLQAAASAAARAAAGITAPPLEMRTGVRAPSPAPGGPPPPLAVLPVFPADLGSWRADLRAGVTALVLSDVPASGPGLAEVFAFDRERLHYAQNKLQELLVAASGLLIVQQLRTVAGTGAPGPHAHDATRRRLLAVVSDPSMRLQDLVSELAALVAAPSSRPASAGGAAAAPTPAAPAAPLAVEDQVRTMFTRIVNPESAAFKSIKSHVGTVLLAHVLYGRGALAPDSDAGRAAAAVLARAGAAALAGDLADLGDKVAGICGVTEAVHGDLLAMMLDSAAPPAQQQE